MYNSFCLGYDITLKRKQEQLDEIIMKKRLLESEEKKLTDEMEEVYQNKKRTICEQEEVKRKISALKTLLEKSD